MALFAAQFVIKLENLWLQKDPPYSEVRRAERRYVCTQIFYAANAEAAYSRALEMLSGFADSNHDGPGDITNYVPLHLHDIDEVHLNETFEKDLSSTFGIDAGLLFLDDVGELSRKKQDLTAFKALRT
jgi:hypothetical protein